MAHLPIAHPPCPALPAVWTHYAVIVYIHYTCLKSKVATPDRRAPSSVKMPTCIIQEALPDPCP